MAQQGFLAAGRLPSRARDRAASGQAAGRRPTRSASGRGIEADVLVIGGGMVGLTLAAALAGAGMSVAVVDEKPSAVALGQGHDGRTSAIALGSKRALEALSLWRRMAPFAEPIREIRVSDWRSPFHLHYDHQELGRDPLGYMVENRHLRQALHGHLSRLAGTRLVAPATVDRLERGSSRVRATLGDGRRLSARLAVAADGRESSIRADAGIAVTRWSYRQTSIVLSVRHERRHDGVAHQRFLPTGPLAVLPMRGKRSSVVWTVRNEVVPAFLALDGEALAREVERHFGHSLGRLTPLPGRWTFPLGLVHADRYVAERLALVGDSAHAIHPIAGQGLNLGMRDVAALAEVVVDAWRLGLDPSLPAVLERYERWRRFDNVTLAAATDGINRLFSNAVPLARLVRGLGLALVDRTPPARRLFMRHAMGLVGELPRLLKGEPL